MTKLSRSGRITASDSDGAAANACSSAAMDMVKTLGKLMNYDENMSVFKNMACASCHLALRWL